MHDQPSSVGNLPPLPGAGPQPGFPTPLSPSTPARRILTTFFFSDTSTKGSSASMSFPPPLLGGFLEGFFPGSTLFFAACRWCSILGHGRGLHLWVFLIRLWREFFVLKKLRGAIFPLLFFPFSRAPWSPQGFFCSSPPRRRGLYSVLFKLVPGDPLPALTPPLSFLFFFS